MSISPEDLEKRLADLRKAVPGRGLERHPSRLRQISELSPELKPSVIGNNLADAVIKEIISFPPQIHHGHHYIPSQALLFTPSGLIHLQASIWPNHDPTITNVPITRLLYAEVTLILLYGFLEIVAQDTTSPIRLGVEFNTVAWDLLSGPIRQLLQGCEVSPKNMTGEIHFIQTRENIFKKLPLKFINGLRIYGMLPGEELEEINFQPGIWERRMLLIRKNIIANTLLLLTSNYLVIIREELQVSQGWIITYIPRVSIARIQNQSKVQWDLLTIILKRDGQTTDIKIRLTAQAAQDWHEIWTKNGGQWQDLPAPTSQSLIISNQL